MSQDKRYAYVTIEDFHSLGKEMKDQTLLAIRAPADTLLEVPRREERKVISGFSLFRSDLIFSAHPSNFIRLLRRLMCKCT